MGFRTGKDPWCHSGAKPSLAVRLRAQNSPNSPAGAAGGPGASSRAQVAAGPSGARRPPAGRPHRAREEEQEGSGHGSEGAVGSGEAF